jgi:hypothetical protein
MKAEQLLMDSQELSQTAVCRKPDKDRNGPTSQWARNLPANPNASLKIGRTVLRARRTKVANNGARVTCLLEAYSAEHGQASATQFSGGMPRTPVALRIVRPWRD